MGQTRPRLSATPKTEKVRAGRDFSFDTPGSRHSIQANCISNLNPPDMTELLVNDPTTWTRLEDHPSFKKYDFTNNWRSWYQSDDQEDLVTLKQFAIALKKFNPMVELNIVVLDDLTVFVEFSHLLTVGQFGIGCDDKTVYLSIDSNPDDANAPEAEFDNLSISDFIEYVASYS